MRLEALVDGSFGYFFDGTPDHARNKCLSSTHEVPASQGSSKLLTVNSIDWGAHGGPFGPLGLLSLGVLKRNIGLREEEMIRQVTRHVSFALLRDSGTHLLCREPFKTNFCSTFGLKFQIPKKDMFPLKIWRKLGARQKSSPTASRVARATWTTS